MENKLDKIIELHKECAEYGLSHSDNDIYIGSNFFQKMFTKEELIDVHTSQSGNSKYYHVVAEYKGDIEDNKKYIFSSCFNESEWKDYANYVHTFTIFKVNTNKYTYACVKLDDKATVQIKNDEEGVAIDLYGNDYESEDAEPVTGTWATYGELIKENKDERNA